MVSIHVKNEDLISKKGLNIKIKGKLPRGSLLWKMGTDGENWLHDDQHIVEMPDAERRMYSKKISLKTFPLFYI
jgi:hypothetical protein